MTRLLMSLMSMAVVFLVACPTTTPPLGERGDACKEHTDCETDLVCAAEKCGTPYARTWQLAIGGAKISAKDRNGDNWDSSGDGKPDPYVQVAVDDQSVLVTQTKDDSLEPTWTESVSISLNNSTRVRIILWDEDFLIPTQIAVAELNGVPVSQLREGKQTVVALTGPGATRDAGPTADDVTSVTFTWSLAP